MLEGARKGSHLKRKPDGKYVGAPDAVTSPQALARMRKELDRLVDEGEIGSDWYSKGRSAVSEITGNDPVANDIWANTIGIMSPQSKPDPNLGTAIRGLGHYAVTGDVPPIVRTGAQADAIREQIASSVHVIVQQSRLSDGSRKVTAIDEVIGIDEDTGEIELRPIFQFVRTGTGSKGEVEGEFRATGYLPSFLQTFIVMGLVKKGEAYL